MSMAGSRPPLTPGMPVTLSFSRESVRLLPAGKGGA